MRIFIKPRLCYTIFILFICNNTFGNWFPQFDNGTVTFHKVFFVDSLNGWVIGEWGTIMNTSDGGNNWVQQISNSDKLLNSIHFINSNIGWIVGNEGEILYTTNGGQNWISKNYENGELDDLKSVHFLDENIGWIVGHKWTNGDSVNAIALKTIDSGNNWTSFNIASGAYIWSGAILNENEIYAVGDETWGSGIIIKTINGGVNWTTQSIISLEWVISISFINPETGWVVGPNGVLLKTVDGGNNWNQQSYIAGALYDVFFLDENIGWISGTKIWNTNDGGDNWEIQLNTDGIISSITFIDSLYGWSVGNGGQIFHTTNGGAPPPSPPQNLTAITDLERIILNWSVNVEGDISHYKIFRNDINEPETALYIDSVAHPNTTYTDWDILLDSTYYYWVSAVDTNGYESELSLNIELTVTLTIVAQTSNSLPTKYKLHNNYPNPFNPVTTFSYQLPRYSFLNLSIYNIAGQLVETLVNEYKDMGSYSVIWNASDIGSGLYFYRIKAGEYTETKKCVILK